MVFKSQKDLKEPKYKKLKIWNTGWETIDIGSPPTGQAVVNQIKKIQQEIENCTDESKQQYINCDEDASYYIKKYLDEHFPNEEWIAEDSFCADIGYGGKIDLYSKSGIFVDFKTKDNLEGKDPAKLVYDEHGMQLSAYAQGCNYNNPQRVSIFVDRKDTSLIACHKWDDETHDRHLNMFNSILQYWKLVKNYDSSLTDA